MRRQWSWRRSIGCLAAASRTSPAGTYVPTTLEGIPYYWMTEIMRCNVVFVISMPLLYTHDCYLISIVFSCLSDRNEIRILANPIYKTNKKHLLKWMIHVKGCQDDVLLYFYNVDWSIQCINWHMIHNIIFSLAFYYYYFECY